MFLSIEQFESKMKLDKIELGDAIIMANTIKYVRNPSEYNKLLKDLQSMRCKIDIYITGKTEEKRIMAVSIERIRKLQRECDELIFQTKMASETVNTDKIKKKYNLLGDDLKDRVKEFEIKYKKILQK